MSIVHRPRTSAAVSTKMVHPFHHIACAPLKIPSSKQTPEKVAKATLVFFFSDCGHDWIQMPVVAQQSHN